MSRNRKVTAEMAQEIVESWLAWKIDPSPFKTPWSETVEPRWGISHTTAYKKIPDYLKHASPEDLRKYERGGWEQPHRNGFADREADLGIEQMLLDRMTQALTEAANAKARVGMLEAFIRTNGLTVPQ